MDHLMNEPIICPHCHRQAIMEDVPDLAAKKWPGRPDLHDIPRVRCPICTASFRKSALENYITQRGA